MKKNLILVGGGLIAAFLLFSRLGCGGSPKIGGKVLVTKVTKKEEVKQGDWEEVDLDFVDGHLTDSMTIVPNITTLEEQLGHVRGRKAYYKKMAFALLRDKQEMDARIKAALDCDEKSRLKTSQIEMLETQLTKSDSLYKVLFADWEDASKRRDYDGTVKTDNYTTEWKATVYGKLPKGGLLLKTDVVQTNTTIEKPYEVWRKNQIDLFGGIDTEVNYLLGIGYERRLFKFAGIYGQAEFYPEQKRAVGKGGFRIHF